MLNQLLALSFDGHSACLIPAPAITAPIHPKAWPVNTNVSARAPKVVQKIKETAVFIAVLLSDRFCCDSVNAKRVPSRVGTALAPNSLMKHLDLGTNRNIDVRACRIPPTGRRNPTDTPLVGRCLQAARGGFAGTAGDNV
jgi:hypothetical protein